MKSFNSVLLCLLHVGFLAFGGLIFQYLEHEVTETVVTTEPPEWTRLKELALKKDPQADKDELESLARWLPRACPGLRSNTVNALVTGEGQTEAVREVEVTCPHLHRENVTEEVTYPWTFFDSFFFCMTVVTTIGYGNLAPTTPWGRIVCILYSLVGIPLTGILLAWTSNFFGDKLLQLFKSGLTDERQQSHSCIAGATFIYTGMGFVIFIFLPAGLFSWMEDWSYLDAVYYSYITLTTIGFGDMVPGNNYQGTLLNLYQVGVTFWILVGLGYWVMVANFITKALKSKRLTTSVKRSAEEMKKLMEQVGLKNHDPAFLRQHSKASINLMLQLSNILAIQEVENGEAGGLKSDLPDNPSASSPGTSSTSNASKPLSPGGIPGISALFEAGLSRNTPLSHLMGPLRKEFNMIHYALASRRTTFDYSVNLTDMADNRRCSAEMDNPAFTDTERQLSRPNPSAHLPHLGPAAMFSWVSPPRTCTRPPPPEEFES